MIDVGMRLGDAIDPFQLANGFEAVIGYECQERTIPPSLTLTMHTRHARCDKASEWVGGSLQCRRGGDLVDVACGCRCFSVATWGIDVVVVLCVCLLTLAKFGESFHAYTRCIRWGGSNSTIYYEEVSGHV
jgi:hypothetical protein